MNPPPLIEIRDAVEADARAIARVHAAAWRATYRGIIPDPVIDSLSEETGAPRFVDLIRANIDPSCPLLSALSAGQLAGFAHARRPKNAPPGFDIEIGAIYVNPADQGKGIGRALVRTAAERFIEAGYTGLLIWAAAENPWRRFYEKLGGELLPATKSPEIGGKPIAHVAYGWRDLKVLLKNCARD